MKQEPTFRLAVASGKGGTGKTFVSANLFYALQQEGKKVNLVDCDAEAPNDKMFFEAGLCSQKEVCQQVPVIDVQACTFCGRCYEYCHYNAIFYVPELKKISVLYDFCHGCGACVAACRDGAITERDDLLGLVSLYKLSEKAALYEARIKVGVHSSVPVLKAAIKEAQEAEIVIMDAPPGTSCPFIQTVARADYVVLVTEPTPFGLSDLKQSVETLESIEIPCGVLVNKAGLGNNEVYDYLEQKQLPLLMEIPFDKGLAATCSGGKLPAQENPEWKERFIHLYQTIKEQYGNSSRKR